MGVMDWVSRRRTASRPRFDVPVIDERTDRELRARYLAGQISIGTYLDRRFGTAFSLTGDHPAAGSTNAAMPG